MTASGVRGEDGSQAWLRYGAIQNEAARLQYANLPAALVVLGDAPALQSARAELIAGVRANARRVLRVEDTAGKEPAIIVGTEEAVRKALPAVSIQAGLKPDGYRLRSVSAEASGIW